MQFQQWWLIAIVFGFLLCWGSPATAGPPPQKNTETPKVKTESPDTNSTNANAIYRRPFINGDASSTSVGGYMEANLNHTSTAGIPEGPSFEFRRFNIFIHSSIAPRISFLSELEFEHGTEEIALETAQIDYKIDTALQLRFGIILPPIGAFNQNHDAPKWEFNDRPLVSTTLLPATLSEPGGGIHGKFLFEQFSLDYQLYATNGLGSGLVTNSTGRTSIPAGKHEGIFEEDNNGFPSFSGRVGFEYFGLGKIGLSAYWGPYNTFEVEGTTVEKRRSVTMLALDYRTEIADRVELRGELGYGQLQRPSGVGPEIGRRQVGGHLDAIAHVWRPDLIEGVDSVLNLNLRSEFVDYNTGSLDETGESIGDEIYAVVPGISFRPVSETVIRANYRREWHVDLQNNAPVDRGVFQFGVATYF